MYHKKNQFVYTKMLLLDGMVFWVSTELRQKNLIDRLLGRNRVFVVSCRFSKDFGMMDTPPFVLKIHHSNYVEREFDNIEILTHTPGYLPPIWVDSIAPNLYKIGDKTYKTLFENGDFVDEKCESKSKSERIED